MVRNITLSVDEVLIKRARKKAEQENSSLNMLFRDWISKYVNSTQIGENYENIMKTLSSVNSGGKFTRDELTERPLTPNERASIPHEGPLIPNER